MKIEIKPFRLELIDDLEELFAQEESSSRCWCMWFIESVKEFHASGSSGNRAKFQELARASSEPMGLIAYSGATAVGWCAVGPKERYARAVKTPTLREVGPSSQLTWFVPCFFVRPEARRTGVTKALLARAIELAGEHCAELVEGFPVAGRRPASSGDRQVGSQGTFSSLGFEVVSRPSEKRVVMRRSTSRAE